MLLGQLLDHGGVQPGSPYYFGNRSHTFIALRLHFLKILLLLSYYFTSKNTRKFPVQCKYRTELNRTIT